MIALIFFIVTVGLIKLLAFICDPEGHAIKEHKARMKVEKKRFENLKK
jgi:hypothetical protein